MSAPTSAPQAFRVQQRSTAHWPRLPLSRIHQHRYAPLRSGLDRRLAARPEGTSSHRRVGRSEFLLPMAQVCAVSLGLIRLSFAGAREGVKILCRRSGEEGAYHDRDRPHPRRVSARGSRFRRAHDHSHVDPSRESCGQHRPNELPTVRHQTNPPLRRGDCSGSKCGEPI